MAPSLSRSIWSRVAGVASLAATPLAPSHYLALVSPLGATHTLKARVESVLDETDDARTLTLRPGRGWRTHRAGQFVRVGVEIDGRIVSRTYSISSAPERADGCITITVKIVPGGKVSGHLARAVKPGDYLTLAQAEGDFVLPDPLPRRALFVTAGSGVTPVMSMLRALALRAETLDAVHMHYAPDSRAAIFGPELAQLAAERAGYHFVLLTTRDAEKRARLDRTQLHAVVPDWETREAWACGPEGLLAAIEAVYAGAGRPDALHVERFRPSFVGRTERSTSDPRPAGGHVRFGLSRADVEADGVTPLLEVAERAGVNAPHGCRMGICHSCDAVVVAGCVRDLRTGRRIDEPGTRIQVCVCAADGDVELAL